MVPTVGRWPALRAGRAHTVAIVESRTPSCRARPQEVIAMIGSCVVSCEIVKHAHRGGGIGVRRGCDIINRTYSSAEEVRRCFGGETGFRDHTRAVFFSLSTRRPTHAVERTPLCLWAAGARSGRVCPVRPERTGSRERFSRSGAAVSYATQTWFFCEGWPAAGAAGGY